MPSLLGASVASPDERRVRNRPAGFSFRDAGRASAAERGSCVAGPIEFCTQTVSDAAAASGYSVREAARLEYDGQFFVGYHVLLL